VSDRRRRHLAPVDLDVLFVALGVGSFRVENEDADHGAKA
jgi:hypothetical protein